LESDDVKTVMVSPMDDLRAAVRRAKPDVIVFTGSLLDQQTLSLVRDQLWGGASVIGLSDVGDPALEARLKHLGFAEVITKPVAPDALRQTVNELLDRQRMARETGLWGESEAVREVLVAIEQMAP